MEPPLQYIHTPMRFDVVLERVPVIRPGTEGKIVDQLPRANVPRSVVRHSPDGYEWGYPGSGPADLSLNILSAYVPPGSDGLPPVKCHYGECSATANRLYQEFKRDVISNIPHEGGHIPAALIVAWLERHRAEAVVV